jgi:integrase/recombinase XerD
VSGEAPPPPPDEPVLSEYLDHLRAERDLSPNTLEAYGRDLRRLQAEARDAGAPLLALDQSALAEHIRRLGDAGLAPRSVARAVHAIRGLYRFGVREGQIERDPMENLRAPRVFPKLPRFLTGSQVEALLAAPDVETPLGLRDRAILEVLYATGLRVSELIGLQAGDLDMEVGLLTAFGKGRKERLVPLGREARDWVARYPGSPAAAALGRSSSASAAGP